MAVLMAAAASNWISISDDKFDAPKRATFAEQINPGLKSAITAYQLTVSTVADSDAVYPILINR